MTLSEGSPKSFNMLRSSARGRLRLLQSILVAALLLTVPLAATESHAVPNANGAHVYLMRGLLNVFSLLKTKA